VQRYWHRTLYYSELCFALLCDCGRKCPTGTAGTRSTLLRRSTAASTLVPPRHGIPCAVVQRDAYLCAAVSLPGLTTTGLSQRSLCATAIFTVPSSLRRIWRVAVRRPYIHRLRRADRCHSVCAFAGSRLSVDRIRDQLSFTAVHEAAAPHPAPPRPTPPRPAYCLWTSSSPPKQRRRLCCCVQEVELAWEASAGAAAIGGGCNGRRALADGCASNASRQMQRAPLLQRVARQLHATGVHCAAPSAERAQHMVTIEQPPSFTVFGNGVPYRHVCSAPGLNRAKVSVGYAPQPNAQGQRTSTAAVATRPTTAMQATHNVEYTIRHTTHHRTCNT
jgi:hypothetical protein